ncbi:MAG: hypothetical protein HYT70_01790 [Candidatus Aenigmarchaeota archaeon]|nr:hypothetical protein [Candidatus Aenigmarchaeota archaeon]
MAYTTLVNGLELYKHSEFPVVVGNPKSSLALCIVWQDVERILNFHPEFKEKFAIIGNLRSPFGVNVALYNLALNPQIRHVVVWGPDKLSNTNIGLAGKNALLELWKSGIDGQKQIVNTPFKLVEEIDGSVIPVILKNVQLHESSNQQQLELDSLPRSPDGAYMEPVKFPEFVVKAPETFPSEGYSYPIREKKGADAFLSLLYHIWKYGQKTPIDTGSEDVKEIRGPVVVIENEDPENIILPEWLLNTKALGISKESLENYFATQFSPETYRKKIFPGIVKFERPRDYSYLYAELMYAFPRPEEVENTVSKLFAKGGYEAAKSFLVVNSKLNNDATHELIMKVDESGLPDEKKIEILIEGLIPVTDQIANVVDRIKRKAVDLDKEVVLWDARYHSRLESGRPCLFKFSFSVRNEKVDLHVFVRSHDIAQAWFFNFYGITKLLGKVAKETGYSPGYIIIESESAHIYQRDWETVEKLLKEQVYDKQVRMYFDPEIDSDPRGVVNIAVIDGSIKVKLQDLKTGDLLFEADGKTAKELMYKIKHFKLISRTDHAAFVGSELAKAEMCMKLGIEYKYDNPIELPSGDRIVS